MAQSSSQKDAIDKAIKKGNGDKGDYVELVMKCPADHHDMVVKDRKASHWNHSSCSKRMEMSQYAHVRCKDNHGDAFINWKWECSKHRGEYLKSDEQFFIASLQSVLANSTFPNVDSLKWFNKLCNNVSAQFGIEDSSDDDD
eukprot:133806_1